MLGEQPPLPHGAVAAAAADCCVSAALPGVALEVPADLPPSRAITRWLAQPLKALLLPTSECSCCCVPHVLLHAWAPPCIHVAAHSCALHPCHAPLLYAPPHTHAHTRRRLHHQQARLPGAEQGAPGAAGPRIQAQHPGARLGSSALHGCATAVLLMSASCCATAVHLR